MSRGAARPYPVPPQGKGSWRLRSALPWCSTRSKSPEAFARDDDVELFWFQSWYDHRCTSRRGLLYSEAQRQMYCPLSQGTITTTCNMTVLNDMDRFYLVSDAISTACRNWGVGQPTSSRRCTTSSL